MKFTIGTVYSRLSQFIAQEAGLILSILLLVYIFPTLTFSMLTVTTGDNPLINLLGSVIDFIASTLSFCLMAFLFEARLTGKAFAIKSSLLMGRQYLLPIFGISLFNGLVIGFGTLLLIIPGIILFVGLCVAIPAYIYEKRTGISDSLRRSWELTRNHRLTIAIIYLPLLSAMALLIFVLFQFYGSFSPDDVLPALLIDAVIFTLVGSLITVTFNLLSIIIYTTLREVKEGQTPDVTAAVFD